VSERFSLVLIETIATVTGLLNELWTKSHGNINLSAKSSAEFRGTLHRSGCQRTSQGMQKPAFASVIEGGNHFDRGHKGTS
jgi:hypothetical protein